MNGIGERIKELREDLSLSQSAFGSRIKTSKQHISKVENGDDSPSDRMVSLIGFEYRVNEEWLRNGTGEKYKPLVTPYTEAHNTQQKLLKSQQPLEPQNDITINITQTLNAEGVAKSLGAAIEFIKVLQDGEFDLLLQICKREADTYERNT